MTSISSRPPPSIASTQSKATAAPAAPAKSSAPAPASSFQAATASGGTTGSGIRGALDDGLKVLKDLEGGGGDAIKKLLSGGVPSSKDLNAAMDEYAEMMENLTPEQRKPLEKAIGTQMMGRSLADSFRNMLQKFEQDALAAMKR